MLLVIVLLLYLSRHIKARDIRRTLSTSIYSALGVLAIMRYINQRFTYLLTLRSSSATALSEPFSSTAFDKRAFRCSAPATWNSLPCTATDSDTLGTLKSSLKHFCFVKRSTNSDSEVTTVWRYRNETIIIIITVMSRLCPFNVKKEGQSYVRARLSVRQK